MSWEETESDKCDFSSQVAIKRCCLQLFVEQTNTNSPVYLRQILALFVPLTGEEHNTNGPILSDHKSSRFQRLRYTTFRGQKKNGSVTKKDCKRCDRAQNINKKGQHSQNVNKLKTNSKEIMLNADQPYNKEIPRPGRQAVLTPGKYHKSTETHFSLLLFYGSFLRLDSKINMCVVRITSWLFFTIVVVFAFCLISRSIKFELLCWFPGLLCPPLLKL